MSTVPYTASEFIELMQNAQEAYTKMLESVQTVQDYLAKAETAAGTAAADAAAAVVEQVQTTLDKKQDKLTGTQGQVVGFDASGKAVAAEVGGTNLLRNSDFQSGTQNFYASRGTGMIDTVDGLTVYKFTSNKDNGVHYIYQLITLGKNVAADAMISFSAFVYTDIPTEAFLQIEEVSNPSVQPSFGGPIGRSQTVTIDGWTRLMCTGQRKWPEQSQVRGLVLLANNEDYDKNIYFYHPKMELGTVATDWSPAPEDLAPLSEVEIAQQMYDRIYEGTDLTVKFATEIAASGGDPWAWIQGRIKAGNYKGIHVKDYIPFECTDESKTKLIADIAGIDTYYNYGDTSVGHHIDFITRERWPKDHVMNKVKYNNGIGGCEYPWLASDGYHWLNSLKGDVPNEEKNNQATVSVDYTNDGVYYFLPNNLKEVIVEKRMRLEKRYSASGILTNSNGVGWADIGKLWVPTECEVYGTHIYGNRDLAVCGSAVQYPIFMGRIGSFNLRGTIGKPNFWLLTPCGSDSEDWCAAPYSGDPVQYNSDMGSVWFPVCFRIA